MQNNRPRASGSNRAKGDGRSRSAGKAYSRSGSGQKKNVRSRRRKASGLQGALIRFSDLISTPRGIAIVGGCFALLILIIVLIGLLGSRGGGQDQVVETVQAVEVPSDVAAADEEAGETTALDTSATQATTGTFTMTPTGDSWRNGKYAPEPQGEGYLPVFRSAARDDKVIAITVDDCFQTANLKQIIQLAEDVGGKITIFPIGNLLKRTELQTVIKAAHEAGHEIENHTWSHDGLYNLTDEELAQHIFDQDRAVDLVLGINYHTHFLRPKGGDDRNDKRTHSYIRQLGYYGIAHWSVSGAMNIDKIKAALTPGAVYLFHCTDADLEKLKEFIPYAATQGYTLLTYNEMFGYEKNEEEPLTDDPAQRTIIPLEPYERDYKTLKATTYDYAAYEVQAALIEQGFLTGTPDGVYGPGTAKSAAAWQAAHGYAGDGVLTTEQQKQLLGVT